MAPKCNSPAAVWFKNSGFPRAAEEVPRAGVGRRTQWNQHGFYYDAPPISRKLFLMFCGVEFK